MNKNSMYNSPFFDISVKVDENSTDIVMALKTTFQTTRFLPHTFDILSKELPGVLQTKCYNDQNLPFNEKVKDTNLAHLFEHIMLQYMVEDTDVTKNKSSYKGVTSWDWREGKDPKGTYRIKVTVDKDEEILVKNALKKALRLVESLCESPALLN